MSKNGRGGGIDNVSSPGDACGRFSSALRRRAARRRPPPEAIDGLPAFAPKDLPVPEEILHAVVGQWVGDYGPFRLGAKSGRLVAELGDGGPTLTPRYQGDATFSIGEEDLVRNVVRGERSDWAAEYAGGLFDSAVYRAP